MSSVAPSLGAVLPTCPMLYTMYLPLEQFYQHVQCCTPCTCTFPWNSFTNMSNVVHHVPSLGAVLPTCPMLYTMYLPLEQFYQHVQCCTPCTFPWNSFTNMSNVVHHVPSLGAVLPACPMYTMYLPLEQFLPTCPMYTMYLPLEQFYQHVQCCTFPCTVLPTCPML